MLCVYALASPFDRKLRATGIAGERLSAVTIGQVAAIAGELARSPRPTESALRKYDRVLGSLFKRLPAIIPVRFGTCFDDVGELTMILRAREHSFRRSLRAVRGRAQMTLRVVPGSGVRGPGSEASSAGTSVRSPIPDPRSPGVAYLRGRAAAVACEHEIPGFAPLRAAVRRWVRDERVEKRGGFVSVYHLVPRASAQAYRRALERSARDARIRLVVSGPWPPYAFSSSF